MGRTNRARVCFAMLLSSILLFTNGVRAYAEPLETVTREQIELYTIDICSDYNIQPEFIQAIIEAESSFQTDAKNGSCIGLMQVNPNCHADRMEELNVTDLYDPYENIVCGVDYINELIQISIDKGYGCDLYYVLMRYNMKTSTADKLYDQGKYSKYARKIVERAHELEVEHYGE